MASAAMIRAKAFATEAGAGNRVGGPGQPTGETTTLSAHHPTLILQNFSVFLGLTIIPQLSHNRSIIIPLTNIVP
jgi:hypothetical protein